MYSDNIMEHIIIIGLLLVILFVLLNKKVEHFDIPLIDPYSVYLHADTTRRESIWREDHKKIEF
jgi:tetrahydromethanopterin S-methyltransferase subunit E